MRKKKVDIYDTITILLFIPFIIVFYIFKGISILLWGCFSKEKENLSTYSNSSNNERLSLYSDKKVMYVEKYSKLIMKVAEINNKYSFKNIKSPCYIITCKSLNEYQKINGYEEAKKKFDCYYNDILKIYYESLENAKLWTEYLKEYQAIEEYLSEDEIASLPKRKMKIKTFMSIERELYIIKKISKPITSINLKCIIKYCSPKGRNSYEKEYILNHNDLSSVIIDNEKKKEEFIEKRRKEALRVQEENRKRKEFEEKLKEKKLKRAEQKEQYQNNVNFVRENSKAYKDVVLLNKKYVFNNVGVPTFKVECSSFSQYQKFSPFKYFKEKYKNNPSKVEQFINKVKENRDLYSKYILEYKELGKCFPSYSLTDLKHLTIDKFNRIELTLYNQDEQRPFMEIKYVYIVEYISPSKRNSYQKKEILNEEQIMVAIKEINNEKEEEERKQIIKQQKIKEQEELRLLLKNKKKLEEKEKELEQREYEFFQATKSHIYSSCLQETSSSNSNKYQKELSSWEKLKELKEEYENGEITYNEYNEKRKNLL